VAIKLALNTVTHNIDRALINEAEMMEAVERHHPESVCRLHHQPRVDDQKLYWKGGAQEQPVFIAMELVDCDCHELRRSGKLSGAAACEGFLLVISALRGVHESGVLHRDIKLNNIAFCLTNSPSEDSSMSEPCVVSARVLDFGEAIMYRPGDTGPRNYGQCRSEYASIARHNDEEQGYKDDLEMLIYALLDMLMTDGLPWKAREWSPRVSRAEMLDRKLRMRTYTGGQQSVLALVRALLELDRAPVRNTPPYNGVEGAIREAWQCELQNVGSGLASSLLYCITHMRS
jgi:serine/threonine protein kinase